MIISKLDRGELTIEEAIPLILKTIEELYGDNMSHNKSMK